MKSKRKFRSNIGGQAVMEGVMMRGVSSMATAVRNPDGNIVVESKRIKPSSQRNFIAKIPIIRGIVNFFASLILGVGTLINSASVFGDVESEPSKFEKWLSDKTKINVVDIAVFIGVVLGIGLSVLLFFILPTKVVDWLKYIPAISNIPEWVRALLEGVIRLAIFIGYVSLTTLMKDVRRTFMYHGAEHKVISCYEKGRELTVENTHDLKTQHDRCGTTFIVIVMVISLVCFALVSAIPGKFGVLMATKSWFRILMRLALLPLVAGVSYELLKLFALSDNWFFKMCKAPGLLLQKLTTKEPTDDMVEVAIVAFKTVMEMDADPSIPPQKFKKSLSVAKANQKFAFDKKKIDEADLDWLICDVMGIERSAIKTTSFISDEQNAKLNEYCTRRLNGEPVQYILGKTNFYGIDVKVTPDVLIPRFETEEVAKKAIDLANEKGYTSVLDLCTGSGAIALAVKKNTKAEVTASDISDKALLVAEENAKDNGLEIKFVQSDMFENVEGKFDLIVSNPPYVTEQEYEGLDETVKKEPKNALVAEDDGLKYYKIMADQAANCLNQGGVVVAEIGSSQGEAVKNIFEERGFKVIVEKDIYGNDRILTAEL